MRDVTFMLAVKVEHPDRLECFDICLRMVQKCFNSDVIVVEIESPIGLSVEDKCVGIESYMHTTDVTAERFRHTKWVNYMTDIARTPIVIMLNTDIIFRPEQVVESVNAVRNGMTLSLPFQPQWGLTYLNEKFRKDFIKDMDLKMLDDQKYYDRTVAEASGGLFVADKKTFRGMCGGENEDMTGWCPVELERVERVEKLGYLTNWIKGPYYHLEHWRGADSGSLDSDESKSEHYLKMQELLLKIRGMDKDQLKAWLATRPWFLEGTS